MPYSILLFSFIFISLFRKNLLIKLALILAPIDQHIHILRKQGHNVELMVRRAFCYKNRHTTLQMWYLKGQTEKFL